MNKKLTLTLATFATLGLGACSSVYKTGDNSAMERVTPVSPEAKSAAVSADASYVTEVSFDQGSAALNDSTRESITELVERAKATGEIDDVKVISWSDLEYPAEGSKKLPKAQKDLASRRAEQIKTYLKQKDSSIDVDTVNMTERPGALARWVNTDNAKVKKSLETAGISTSANETSVVAGKAGKAMVMVILK